MKKQRDQEIQAIVTKLKRHQLSIFDIPQNYKLDPEMIACERELGFRKFHYRGFDVITNQFFVEELGLVWDTKDGNWEHLSTNHFQSFDDYYDYLNGQIYENSCYTFWEPPIETLEKFDIDINRLMCRRSFIEETIQETFPAAEKKQREDEQHKKAVRLHRDCIKWIQKFDTCSTLGELQIMAEKYRRSKNADVVGLEFFFYNYIYAGLTDEKRFDVVMEYMSTGLYPEYKIIRSLCSIYNPDKVLESYRYSCGTKGTQYKHKKKLKEYVHRLKSDEFEFFHYGYFDERTRFFCDENRVYEKKSKYPITVIPQYFENFDDFAAFRQNDLTNCDLSGADFLDCNFSKYVTDETTVFPEVEENSVSVSCNITKEYYHGSFYVTQGWINSTGKIIEQKTHTFDYFFDFVSYLKGNLQNADLLLCSGLKNLTNYGAIDFSGAKLTSDLSRKFGVSYERYEPRCDLINDFALPLENEQKNEIVLLENQVSEEITSAGELNTQKNKAGFQGQYIYYISDLHLMHRFRNAHCKSKEDVEYILETTALEISKEAHGVLLLNGDIASDYTIFEQFVAILSQTLNSNTSVFFTLGNHEFWDFPGKSIEEVAEIYRSLLSKYGMYLLHNDLFYRADTDEGTDGKNFSYISVRELLESDAKTIKEKLRKVRFAIWGGTGFSGRNQSFNAENGIYRAVVDRESEINQSKLCDLIYRKIAPILSEKNAVIMTHMPVNDWCADVELYKNIYYVNGHTHRNIFYDDGAYHLYADNQIGYTGKAIHLKSFLMGDDYDVFSDVADGIHEISREQYKDFYCGKNIMMQFTRNTYKRLWMLKKKGNYCFIQESALGELSILNGGSKKMLSYSNLQYYYHNMDGVITRIKQPLSQYTEYQEQIAQTIKQIGGSGEIHGCIVDIDFSNHVYVDPVNGHVTAYWAENMVDKKVYPSALALIEQQCPGLYANYCQLLENNGAALSALRNEEISLQGVTYLNTDMYKASRELKKMQRLQSNILSTWYEPESNSKDNSGECTIDGDRQRMALNDAGWHRP